LAAAEAWRRSSCPCSRAAAATGLRIDRELAVLCDALEDAWSCIERRFDGPQSQQDARTKLAGIIVMLARSRPVERDQLRNGAIQMMERFFE
jgi:hypothetical protein